jgi:energy-coupling factor transport system permease protein
VELASRFPVGQYVPRDSVPHALDPRAKIMITTALVVALFFVRSFPTLGALWLVLVCVVAWAKVPLGFALRPIRSVLPLIAISGIVNLFFHGGEAGRELFRVGPLIATSGGLWTGALIGARLIMLVFVTTVLTLTTSPVALTDGLERLLAPAARVGVPAHELAMMTTIALRFIPTLLEETEKIMKAQLARGAEFDRGGLPARVRAFIPVLVPLMVSAFRRSEDLALAMEARGYRGGAGRTRMTPLRWRAADVVALALAALAVAALVRFR